MNDHADVEELKAEAHVPVINALSDLHHPLQTLADLMTIQVLLLLCTALDVAPTPSMILAPGEALKETYAG